MTTAVETFAPAKINLTLHVTGQRPDGYHLIDSLVAFADVGDTVYAEPADRLTLKIDGPFASQLAATDDNLVLRAARLLSPDRGAALTLVKRLPVASGIGGGSADAAATLRALSELWDMPLPEDHRLTALGADVLVCLTPRLTRMRGIGDVLEPLGGTPDFDLLLLNPGIGVATPAVFAALAQKDNPPIETLPPPPGDRDGWIAWLAAQRNDLEGPATTLAPAIGDVLAELRALPGCRLARMSGSGATCFGLFDPATPPDPGPISLRHPDWWVAGTAGYDAGVS